MSKIKRRGFFGSIIAGIAAVVVGSRLDLEAIAPSETEVEPNLDWDGTEDGAHQESNSEFTATWIAPRKRHPKSADDGVCYVNETTDGLYSMIDGKWVRCFVGGEG